MEENTGVQIIPADSSAVFSEVQDDVETIISGDQVVNQDIASETVLSSDEVAHPIMSTPLDDYTVSEGLLLLILVSLVVGKLIDWFRW